MKQEQFALLVQTGVITRAVIYGTPQGWELWGYPDEGDQLAPDLGNRLHTTRGAVRTWTTLDAAYRFLQSVGAVAPRVAVAIEGATEGGADGR